MRRQASSVRRYGQSHTLVGNARFGGEGDGVATRLLPSVVRAFAALLLGVSSAAFEFFTRSELQAFCDSSNWDEKTHRFALVLGFPRARAPLAALIVRARTKTECHRAVSHCAYS